MSYVLEALLHHATQQPDATAVLTAEGKLSYAELAGEVRDFARLLEGTHCHTVGIDLDNGKDWVLSDLAAMQLELTAVPIPGFFTTAQVTHLLDAAQVDLLVRDRNASPGEEWQVIPCQQRDLYLYHRLSKRRSHAAKITFTSGSTGQPRGVELSQQAINDTARGIVSALEPLCLRRHLSVLPLATLLENIAGLYAPLVNGSEAQIPSLKKVGLSGAALEIGTFVELLGNAEADSMILVPQLLTAIVTLSEIGLLNLQNYKMLAVGGGRVSKALLDKAAQFGLPVFEGYGLSECGSVLTLNLPNANRPGSVGRPLPHAEIRISSSCEVEIHGSVMNGYLSDSADDSTSNVPDWYPTGDLGHLDSDGFLHITGRKKSVFITSYGRNVNPEWVEAALSQKPAVAQAVAYGEARDHNLALLWLRFEQNDEQLAALVAEVNLELPDYAQVHDYMVITEPLPQWLMTANGRVKREQVIERYLALIEDHYEPNQSHGLRRLTNVIL
ncbi:MAG: long-subunit acyl-CoA synthetase (AMP-forming) [Candidatus Azotimanducaceae bacterium]|jgi:long-subunit acyl-CoA synthetase (AMP-forming)